MADGKIEYEVRADTSNVDGDLEQASKKMEEHTSKWDKIMEGAQKEIGKELTNLAEEAVKAAWELGTGFEDGLAKVSTLVDTSTTDMDQLGASLLDLSSKYGVSATSLAESAYSAISANNALAGDTEGLMKLLDSSAKLAAAGFTDVDTAMNATIAVMNAYGMGVQDVDEIQRMLIQTQNSGTTTVGELGNALSGVTASAAAAGVGFDEVSAAMATITSNKVSTATAVTDLNAMILELSKSGTTASENLAKAAQGTQYAGMSFAQMKDAGVPLNDILNMMSDYASKNNLSMMDMFGSITAGQAALMLTGESAEKFSGNLETMTQETDAVGEAFDKVSGTTSFQMQQAMSQLQAVLISLFNALSPIIKVVLDIASTMIQAISSALTPFTQAIQPIIDIVMALCKVIGETLTGVIKGALEFISSALQNGFEVFKGVFGGIIDFITGVFTGNWQQAWQGIVNIFSSIINGIGNIFKAPLNFVIDGINGFINGINKLEIPDWVPVVGGLGFHLPTIPRLKVGMDYVPTDDFPAILHKGEAVLTAGEAANWRGGAGRGGFGSDGDMEKLAAMIANEMSRVQIPVYLDGREVGRGVEPYVSDRQARRIESRQRSGWNGRV